MGVYHLIDGILTIFSIDSMLIIYAPMSSVLLSLELHTVPLDHARLSQKGQRGFRHAEFPTENLLVVLADEGSTPADTPGRTVINRRPTGVDEAAAEFRVLDFREETAVVQMRIVDNLVYRAYAPPGEAVFLPSAPGIFLRHIRKKVLQYLANVPQVRLNGRRVLILLVQQILRQPVLV